MGIKLKDGKVCKKCLLQEAAMQETADRIKQYIERIDKDIRTTPREYENRLKVCKNCIDLIDGTCLKCGCFVEMRAAIKDKHCPNVPLKW